MDKLITVKLFNIEMKLTDVRKLDRCDYIHFFVFTMAMAMFHSYFFLLMAYYMYPPFKYVIFLYCIWIYIDKDAHNKRGRTPNRSGFRNSQILKSVAHNFPISLIKTADLPTGKNYIFGCYPHGVLPLNGLFNFLTNATGADELFPGISKHVATVPAFFFIPLLREMYRHCGVCSCSENSIKYILSSGTSKAVILYPGGSPEMQLSQPGNTYKIVSSQRKGFIRVAIETGTSLVPVFTFGELDCYKGYYPFNGFGKQLTGGQVFLVNGRGYLQHHFGLLPHKRPIKTIVGKPIPVQKVENPTAELIDEYHEIFFGALRNLFDEYKDEFSTPEEEAKLIMT